MAVEGYRVAVRDLLSKPAERKVEGCGSREAAEPDELDQPPCRSPVHLAILAILAGSPSGPVPPVVPIRSERIITTEGGTCIEGPHEPTRTRRLPGVAATSDRPHSQWVEAYVHCPETPPRRETGLVGERRKGIPVR